MTGETAIERQYDLARQDTPQEIHIYRLGVQDLIVRAWEGTPEVYKRAGTARSYNQMVAHDGPVLVKGRFREIVHNDGLLEAYHPYGGRMEIIPKQDTVDVPALLLAEVDRVA